MKTTSAVWSGDNLHEVIGVIGLSAVARQMSWGEYEELVRREGLKVFTSDGPVVIEVGDIVFNSVGVVTVLHPERKQGMTLKEGISSVAAVRGLAFWKGLPHRGRGVPPPTSIGRLSNLSSQRRGCTSR